MFKILIAEDDRELRQLFAHVLTKNGYTVLGVSNGEEALAALEQSYYDLIISDIMMPKMDGYELVRSVRESGSSIPIMMITAKDAFDDMRLGFLSGSDDYMVKPINIGEMVLRVSALLRRAQMASERRQVIGGTVMECDSLSITVGGESLVLPQKEFMLLYKMASFPGRSFTRQQLMDDIWGYDSSTDTHTVDVHIARLRERFRDNSDFKIVTMRGVGYKVVRSSNSAATDFLISACSFSSSAWQALSSWRFWPRSQAGGWSISASMCRCSSGCLFSRCCSAAARRRASPSRSSRPSPVFRTA